jgi:uncharacterized RDD family membrane protein YckC
VTDGGWDIRCNSCGAAVPSTAEMCSACGAVLLGPPTPPPTPATRSTAANPTVSVASAPLPSGAAPRITYAGQSDWAYAGLGIRGAAWLIDTIILMLPVLAAVAFPVAWFVVFPSVLLYYPVMESSRLQATLGKRFCGLTVVTTGVKRISFARALLRFLARYLSGVVFGIGYLMIAFRRDRRGLHDMIAGTLVLWR